VTAPPGAADPAVSRELAAIAERRRTDSRGYYRDDAMQRRERELIAIRDGLPVVQSPGGAAQAIAAMAHGEDVLAQMSPGDVAYANQNASAVARQIIDWTGCSHADLDAVINEMRRECPSALSKLQKLIWREGVGDLRRLRDKFKGRLTLVEETKLQQILQRVGV
jgi:hypothetical protein